MEGVAVRAQYFRGNVFVANLPPDLTEDELAEAFDPFGIVLSAFIARDPETGKRLRYGFVDIATEKAAKLAVESMNGTQIDGHNLDVRISERPTKASKQRRPASQAAARRPTARPNGEAQRPSPQLRDQPMEPAEERPPRPQRKTPSFVVERRPLPHRF
jgi:RNA recognition motif-containing protein